MTLIRHRANMWYQTDILPSWEACTHLGYETVRVELMLTWK